MRRVIATISLLLGLIALPAAAHAADRSPLTYDEMRVDRDALATALAIPRVEVPGNGAVRVTAFHAALAR